MGPLGSLTNIKTKHHIWSLGHPQERPYPEEANIKHGTSPPWKITLPSQPSLSQFSPHPGESSQAVSYPPSSLPVHSFIHSLIHQTLTGTYCVSATVSGPGKTGGQTQPAGQPWWGQGGRHFPAPLIPGRHHARPALRRTTASPFLLPSASPRAGAAAQKIFLFTRIIGFFF